MLSALRAMGASLLVSAAASLLRCFLGAALISHGTKLTFGQLADLLDHLVIVSMRSSQCSLLTSRALLSIVNVHER